MKHFGIGVDVVIVVALLAEGVIWLSHPAIPVTRTDLAPLAVFIASLFITRIISNK